MTTGGGVAGTGAGGRRRRLDRGSRNRIPPATSAELLLAEYTSLREESASARAAQQSTLQWSLAAIAALFVAGTVLVSDGGDRAVLGGARGYLFVALFGCVLPGVSLLSCMSWCGELIRMERAGAYLRGLERWAARSGPGAPLRWETYIHRSVGSGGKQQVGYVGSLGLYAGAYVVPLGLLTWNVLARDFSAADGWVRSAALGGIGVIVLAGLVLIGRVVQFIRGYGRWIVRYEDIDPSVTRFARQDFLERPGRTGRRRP